MVEDSQLEIGMLVSGSSRSSPFEMGHSLQDTDDARLSLVEDEIVDAEVSMYQ